MPISGGSQSSQVNVFSSGAISGAIEVTSSLANPVWITGNLAVSVPAPSGTTVVTSTLADPVVAQILQTSSLVVTSSEAAPIWITSSNGGGNVNITATITLPVTSSITDVRVTTPAQADAGYYATVFPGFGELRVQDEPTSLMFDPFDQIIDTNHWLTPTSGSGALAAYIAAGNLTLDPGITTGGYTYLQSVPRFKSTTPAWIRFAWNAQLEYPTNLGSYRFIGAASKITGPISAAQPFGSDGSAIGFEVYTDGKMYAVMYSAGVRFIIQDFSTDGNSKQPVDSLTHNYSVFYRPTKSYWYIDNTEIPAAISSLANVLNEEQLAPIYISINDGTRSLLLSNAMSVADTGKNNIQISDPLYPFKRVSVVEISGANPSTGVLPPYGLTTQGLNYGWSTDQNAWFPILREGTDEDGDPVINAGVAGPGVLSTEAYQKVFNGVTWDRARGDVTGTWIKMSGSTALPVTSSVSSPVYVSSTITNPVNSVGLHGVTGSVAITSGVITSITNNVHTDGLHGVTGTIAVSSGVITAHADGLVGVTGTVAISSGVITAHADGLVGVTGTVSITSGTITTITNAVTTVGLHGVTGTVAVSSGTITAQGLVGVTGAVAITSGVITSITNAVVVTSTLANPSYVTSTIANPVNITASQNSPVTVAVTGVLPITGTTTLGLTSSLPTTGLHGVTGTITAINASGVFNVNQTGSWIIGGVVTASYTGTVTVSQSNPVLTASVAQTGAWIITGTVTQNVPAFPSISGAITNAGDTVTLAIGQAVGVMFCCEGTFSGNIRPQISFDNQLNWHIVECVNPDYRVENIFTRISSSGIFQPYYIAGATHVRLSATAMTSGQASVYISTNNVSPHVDMSAVEQDEAIPKYGTMVGGNDGGIFRFVKVDQSGALYVSSSNDRPVWITGSITSVVSTTGTFVAIENSVGGDGQIAPVSATLVGGHNTGNLQSINVTSQGNVVVTGNVTAHQTGAYVVTSSIANPVWITGAIATTAGTQLVTSTLAEPVWVTGTTTVTGVLTSSIVITSSLPVTVQNTVIVVTASIDSPVWTTSTAPNNDLKLAGDGAQYVTSSNALPVWVTGGLEVTASQNNPVTVAITGTWPVTGTVTVGYTATLPVHADGLVGVTGAVAITSGVITSVTNPVVITATVAAPAYVTSTITSPVNVTASSANPVSVAIIGGTTSGKQYLTGTDLDGGTGTLMIGVDATNVARAAFMTAQGYLAVSQTNPSAATGGGGGIPTATLNPASGNLMLGMNNTGTVGIAATPGGILKVTMGEPGTMEAFGSLVTSMRVPQAQAQFFAQSPNSQLFVSAANGAVASGPTNGLAVISSSVAATARITGTTPGTVLYTSHYEVYGAWTWQFFTPTNATSYQRIGLYNDTDGFFVGWNNQQFGITSRYSTSDTFVTQSQWNVDTLTGGANSRFTSGSIPVALDPSKLNLYRVRLGWLGAAPIVYEVASPDGEWVTFHVIHMPNSLNGRASITNPNLPIKFDINKSAGADDITCYAGCFVAGVASYQGASVIDWNNSTRSPLGAGSSFTGSATSVSSYNQIRLSVIADQTSSAAGANSGLRVQFSQDGLAWGDEQRFTFNADGVNSGGQTFIVSPRADYYRVIYQNGTSVQNTFNLESFLASIPSQGDQASVDQGPAPTQMGAVTISTMWGPTGTISGAYGFAPASVAALGGMYVTSTVASPVVVTGILEARQTGTWQVTGTVNVNQTGSSVITGTVTINHSASIPVNGLIGVTGSIAVASGVITSIVNNVHTDGLMGVSGTVAITSGVLTSITNPVVVTSALASPLWITSSAAVIVTVSQTNIPNGTHVVTSSQANPAWITGTLAGVSGVVTVGGALQVTGATTPSDAFANPTNAILAGVLNMLWNAGASQWQRAPGHSVSGTIVQTRPPANSTVTQVTIPGNSVTTVLAANVNRLGASIQNVGSSTFASHVKLGSAATLASYTVRIAQNGYYEVPAGYNGIITAINSGSQTTILHVTELTQ
jgi:hypothetical protein